MSSWKKLGIYLSRAVKLSDASSKQWVEIDELENSVVLVILGSAISKESMTLLLKTMIAQNPSAIVLFGVNARIAFDLLILELSDGASRPHIMTGLSEESEIEAVVEDLLLAKWPSEERFDVWTDYAILNIDGDLDSIEQAVKNNTQTP